MAVSRVFTKEELEEMGRRTVDLLTEAIEEGDEKRAKELAKRMYREFAFMHDLYRDWAAGFMDYIYRNYGEDALYQALRKVAGSPGRPSANTDKQDFRRQVQGLAHVLRGHLEAMKVEEDDEKVCMQMQPCGSGQRLFEEGSYDPPRNLTMIQKPHPMTWGLTDFPIYCTHCPVLVILSIEQLGYPAVVAVPGEKVASGSCKYCIYKDPKDIPEELYIMLGKQKPK
jgi:hypothetical protein